MRYATEMGRMRTRALAALAAAITTLALASPARAATIDVDTTADELNADGDCALREAVRAANSNLAVDACTAGETTADTIDVGPGTYTLAIAGGREDAAASGDLDLTGGASGPVAVAGAGARTTTVDGADLDRVFDVRGATAEISGLTITNGTAPLSTRPSSVEEPEPGGGVLVDSGTLTLRAAAVTHNITSRRFVFVFIPRFSRLIPISGYGGGVASFGTIEVLDSVISANQGRGSVAQLAGTAEIANTTVSANPASGPFDGAGGIRAQGLAGAGAASVKLTNATVNGNGGANLETQDVSATASIETENSIVANPGGGGANCATTGGTITSSGGNLEFAGNSCGFTAAGDKQHQNPLLRALADNGGPTDTHALGGASPAIDAARSSGCPATDQRGVARPQDGDASGAAVCDMGAFELRAPPFFSVGNARVTEGGSGTRLATFAVTRTKGEGAASVGFTTANGSASAGSDYNARSGRVSFAAGQTRRTVRVAVRGDRSDEPNEAFRLDLRSPSSGVAIGDGQGIGTIVDDDQGGGARCTISRSHGSDIIRGTPGNDVICAGGGNDIVYGGGGNDQIRGASGNDVVGGDEGNDRLEGSSGNDNLIGGAGNDRVLGGSGRDVHTGQLGGDFLHARDGVRGNDIANGGSGSDSCTADGRDVRTGC